MHAWLHACVRVHAGRRPFYKGLNLEGMGVKLDARGRITVRVCACVEGVCVDRVGWVWGATNPVHSCRNWHGPVQLCVWLIGFDLFNFRIWILGHMFQ
jgi:hypothetical protein